MPDRKLPQIRNKSRRDTGNRARAGRRKTEIDKEPFAKQKQNAEKLESTKTRNKACQKITVKIRIAFDGARMQAEQSATEIQ
jgi:hypothetical protein